MKPDTPTWNDDGSINWNDLKNPRVAFSVCAACGSDLVWSGIGNHWMTFQDSKRNTRDPRACAFHEVCVAAAAVYYNHEGV